MTPTERAVARLPSHLRRYVIDQDHAAYTPRDHAVWRAILRRMVGQVRDTAHPAWLRGLEATGIGLDTIPTLDEMNDRLAAVGWSAVGVRGFVPPEVFVELQSRCVLAIAADIRTHQHLLYTPAPDIVHEAAGHAPLVTDPRFAAFLRRVGEVGHRAIAAREDWEVFRAIRALSAAKEDPTSTLPRLDEVARGLAAALASRRYTSEASRASRLYWWTAEFGLVGDLHGPRICGAGLLSSLGESARCLTDAVEKVPLSLECVDQDYDITSMQPRLFVARDWDHLFEVVDAFERTLSWWNGGDAGLAEALRGGTVCHVTVDDGTQISGVVSAVFRARRDVVPGIRTAVAVVDGPVQIARAGRAVGTSADPTVLVVGTGGIPERGPFRVRFASGLELSGAAEGGIAVAGLAGTLDGEALPLPERARVRVAAGVPSVGGGAADREAWDLAFGPPDGVDDHAEQMARIRKARALPPALAALYAEVRAAREAGGADPGRLREIAETARRDHPEEGLLVDEVEELIGVRAGAGPASRSPSPGAGTP